MSKFDRAAVAAHAGPVVTEARPSGRTYEGGVGYARDTRSELRLLAVANMVGEDTFYESAAARDARYRELVAASAVADPQWTADFLFWLRTEANLRTAALVGACEYVHARLQLARGDLPKGVDGLPAVGNEARTNRQVISSVCRRADEPGEILAYWASQYGESFPAPVKRGVGDAAVRLYTEYFVAKYDREGALYPPGRVLELCHPVTDKEWQRDLFTYLLDVRHENLDPAKTWERLPMVTARRAFLAMPAETRRAALSAPDAAERVQAAGITHEALAGWLGDKALGADGWAAVIPSMGYFALLRNLANFDRATISDELVNLVAARLADPQRVARSGVLPMQFLSAYRQAGARWRGTLEAAIGYSLVAIPQLPGRTLVLVDTSSSMHSSFSKDGTLMRWDAAVIFGLALGARCQSADVVSFSSAQTYFSDPRGAKTKVFYPQAGEGLLAGVGRWEREGYFLGGGTDTAGALAQHYAGHDRVVILTDEQANRDSADGVGAHLPCPMYTWDLAGFRYGHAPSNTDGRRFTFGGLADSAFSVIPTLEAEGLPTLALH